MSTKNLASTNLAYSLTKSELISVLLQLPTESVDALVSSTINSRPPKQKSITRNEIRSTLDRNQVASVSSIMKNASRVIPVQVTSMGIKCKVMNTLTDETVTSGQFAERFDDLNDVLSLVVGEESDRTLEDEELYKRYSDSVNYFIVYEITEHVRDSVCSLLKTVLSHCYSTTYTVDMFNIIDDETSPQLICVLFMEMTTKSSFDAVFNK